MKNSLMILTTCLVIGCGGGGSTGTSTATASSIAAPAPAPAPAPIPKTSALTDNKTPITTKFQQFETFVSQLPDKTAQFKDPKIYIKVYVTDGHSLYLGRYDPKTPLSLHLPNHIKSIKVDIFSATSTDPQLTEEIRL